MSRIVIALGGNALGDNAAEQREKIREACPSLIGLIAQGHEIIVSHGNGPQVGMINTAFDIACGGGGIPVVKDKEGDFNGVPAIIDKDFASAKLAEVVGADHLFILTAVDRVCLDFGMPTERALTEMTAEEAERWCEEGQFAPGSMLPKVQAAVEFARAKKGNKAIIASLEKAPLAMRGESGTVITA